jgi:hypothetical protein
MGNKFKHYADSIFITIAVLEPLITAIHMEYSQFFSLCVLCIYNAHSKKQKIILMPVLLKHKIRISLITISFLIIFEYKLQLKKKEN